MTDNIVDLAIPRPPATAADDAAKALAAVRVFRITNPDESVELQTLRQSINTRIKTLTEERKKLTAPIDDAKSRIMEFFRGPLDTLEAAKAAADQEILAYTAQVEAARKEAERKAAEVAEKERRRLAAQAEEKRLRELAAQRERDAIAKKEREQAERAQREARERERAAKEAGDREAAAQAERDRLAAKAAQEAADREHARKSEEARIKAEQEAAAVEARAAAVVAPLVVSEAPKVKGVALRDNWTFEIRDVAKIPREFLIPDETKIGKLVKAMQADAQAMLGDGVRVFNQPVVASRKAAL